MQKNMISTIILVLFFGNNLLMAIQPVNTDSLKLIPSPQLVSRGNGGFLLDKHVRIFVASSKSQSDHFSALQLNKEIEKKIGKGLNLSKASRGKTIMLLSFGKPESSKLIKKFHLEQPEQIGDQGYVLQIRKEEIIIAANTETGLFYGVQTLKQLIRSNMTANTLPCITITDWPSLQYRGWMDDISRGPIPTLDFLKKEVVRLSEYKLNYFTLYTENVFRLKAFPDIAPLDGITAEEISELNVFAKKYHLELIGNEQSFGHWDKTLSSPFYDSIRENNQTLSPAVEETYTVLKKIYSEIVPAYESKFFNINCDETGGLGIGKTKKMLDTTTIGGIYAYHINRINDILKPYNRRIMMWGDIAVRNKDIIKRLPKDMIILSWGYDANESFDNVILPFKESGFDFMVAPGVSCWNQIWPNMTNACINISNYIRDGAKLGAIGMMNTAWDDDGENFFNYNWHGLAWGAECAWKPIDSQLTTYSKATYSKKLDQFNSSFSQLMFGDAGVSEPLFQFDSIRKQPVREMVWDKSFWADMYDISPKNTDDAALQNNQKIVAMADNLIKELTSKKASVKQNADILDYPLFAAKRVRFAAMQNLGRITLAKALKTEDPLDIAKVKDSFSLLLTQLHALKMTYIVLWERENKPWWLDKILAKYDEQGNRLLEVDKKVLIEPQSSIENGLQNIKLRTAFNEREIRYTINESNPTIKSELYTKPFPIAGSSLIRACIFENNVGGPVSEMVVGVK